MSQDLIWLLTRNNTSFLVKRNGVQLTSEPGNVFNVHAQEFSGLATKKPVNIAAGSKGAVLTIKNQKIDNKPKAAAVKVALSKDARKSKRSVGNILRAYRPELAEAAQYRVARIFASQYPVKAQKPKKTRGVKKN
ncbi:ribosomal protein L28e [Gorgonomyces haynaldii]|nr:ribosomal protein L28e [Gorgonomyces haynaldii]